MIALTVRYWLVVTPQSEQFALVANTTGTSNTAVGLLDA